MQKIHIPRSNTNDDTCVLIEWFFEDGQEVQNEDVVASMETSKANTEVLSPGSGILHRLGKEGEEYAIDSCIGYLFANREEYTSFLTAETAPEARAQTSLILTRDAQELVNKHGITEGQLRSLGKALLKKDDILTLITPSAPEPPAHTVPSLSRNQSIIAKRVTLAHQTIPSAFAAIKISCDTALTELATYIEQNDLIIGLAEVFVKLLGDMQQLYPDFYQSTEAATVGVSEKSASPNVGITMDVGTGLYIPVLKSVSTKSLADIADEMMGFRMKALRQTFKEEDLSGGHITLSLNTDNDITLAIPIIFPTQICILSLCSLQEELYLDTDGSVKVRRYCNLGMAYDHRSINGATAIQFLQTLKSKVEALTVLELSQET